MNPLSTLRSFLRPLALTAVFSASLALAGCGGGGGGEEDDDQEIVIQQVTITSTPELDGVVFSSNNQQQGRSDLPPHIGDFAFVAGQGQGILQAVYSFDLSELPEGAVIRGATMNLAVTDQIGNPEALLQTVRVDHVNFANIFPQSFGMNVLDAAFVDLENFATLGLKQIDVTEQVQADMESTRTRSQYRLRSLGSNLDDENDAIEMSDAEGTTGGQNPILVLEIEIPVAN